MREQALAILWAQLRITRNHFPRTSFGTLLSWSVSAIWYMLFLLFAVLIARALESTPTEYLVLSMSIGLLVVFAYMLVIPLVTVSAGWSLQLDKLQAFPIGDNTLFLIETLLRLTSSPEMLILLAGASVGLLLRGDVFPLAPLFLLLFLSFSLFIQLALRDFILHAFARNRFREVIALFFACIALLPQLFIREKTLRLLKPYFLTIANGRLTPWHQFAAQSTGHFSLQGLAFILGWNVIAIVVARLQFMNSLRREDSFRPPALINQVSSKGKDLIGKLTHSLPDPFGVLVEKEFRTLVRMPRFRVLFGMACVFSIFVFMPVAMNVDRNSFLGKNALPITSLYGLLLLSDALLLNVFGFDRAAVQVYFATPVSISTVIRAKNLAAVAFIALQSLAVPLLLLLFRVKYTWLSVIAGFLSATVETVFLLSAGNLLSVFVPRPIDPRTSFRQQSGGKAQLWLVGCTFGMFLLVSMAFLARWATDRDWVLMATLGLEIAIGLVVYRISLDETIERAVASREQIVSALSKNASPLSS